jgi:hypothetical protein
MKMTGRDSERLNMITNFKLKDSDCGQCWQKTGRDNNEGERTKMGFLSNIP